jgi:hypothetical protein
LRRKDRAKSQGINKSGKQDESLESLIKMFSSSLNVWERPHVLWISSSTPPLSYRRTTAKPEGRDFGQLHLTWQGLCLRLMPRLGPGSWCLFYVRI